MFLVFLIFYLKKKKAVTPYHLPKKRGALKSTPKISFLRDTFFRGLSQWQLRWGCRGLSFVLDLSDQICTYVLHGLA